MRVLVCGGRNYWDRTTFFTALKQVILDFRHTSKSYLDTNDKLVIISGGAKGADTLAKEFALYWGIEFLEFKADWEQYGKAAGFIRNKQMLDEGKPDLVVAFPGGNGTANMKAITKFAKIKLIEVGKDGKVTEC
jgi:hypothetical protein